VVGSVRWPVAVDETRGEEDDTLGLSGEGEEDVAWRWSRGLVAAEKGKGRLVQGRTTDGSTERGEFWRGGVAMFGRRR